MSRWIDAEKLIKKYGDWYTEEGLEVGFIGSIEQLIEMQPSIDLVRCKDCIHCADDYIDVGMGTMPQFTCELGRCGESVQPDDFCSYGERKDT